MWEGTVASGLFSEGSRHHSEEQVEGSDCLDSSFGVCPPLLIHKMLESRHGLNALAEGGRRPHVGLMVSGMDGRDLSWLLNSNDIFLDGFSDVGSLSQWAADLTITDTLFCLEVV